jgi:bifunctional non-homologous end joining protein LigD
VARDPPVPSYRPQLALLVSEPPSGPGWVHEVKYDGYRIGCAIEGGRATLWSRRERDWTAQFPEVAEAARQLRVRSALLDGEVAAVLPDGRTSFQALQNAFSGGPRSLAYLAFDLLWLDGEDLSARTLLERKAALERLLSDVRGIVRYAPHVTGRGDAVLREACQLGLEGIVSKRADLPYRAGRGGGWTKAKCIARQELVIGGFTDPEGSRQGVGALLVGHHQDGALRYAGKVGTGFTVASANAVRARLEPLEVPACPFTPPLAGRLGREAHWVKPRLVAEVAFTEWTSDGKIRHPSFQGLREDKRAEDVVREDVAAAGTADDAPQAAKGRSAVKAPVARTSPAPEARTKANVPPAREAPPAAKAPPGAEASPIDKPPAVRKSPAPTAPPIAKAPPGAEASPIDKPPAARKSPAPAAPPVAKAPPVARARARSKTTSRTPARRKARP